jgi:hypothetical protein
MIGLCRSCEAAVLFRSRGPAGVVVKLMRGWNQNMRRKRRLLFPDSHWKRCLFFSGATVFLLASDFFDQILISHSAKAALGKINQFGAGSG